MKNPFAKRIGKKWISLMEIWKPFKNPKKLKIKWKSEFFPESKEITCVVYEWKFHPKTYLININTKKIA